MKKDSELLPWLLFVLTGLVYLPLGLWLYEQTAGHDQLFQALIVLLFTGFLLYLERRARIRLKIHFRSSSMNLLLAAYLCIGISTFLGSGLLFLVSFCLFLVALADFLFGSKVSRNLIPVFTGFGIFLLIILLLPALDWPLRSLAGQCAQWGLSALGRDAALQLAQSREGPILLLLSGGIPFHVASECNGFGILASSLLMSLLFVMTDRHRALPVRFGLLAASAGLAFLFNGLRIIIIVLLAPIVGSGNYDFMHEAVGILTTYGCLFLVYLLFRRKGPGEKASCQAGRPS